MRAALILSVAVTACGGGRSVSAPSPLIPPAPVARLDAPSAAITAPVATPPATTPRSATTRPPNRLPPELVPLAGRGGAVVIIPRDVRNRDETIIFEGPLISVRASELVFDRKSDFWSPCVRDFVETQPEAAREALGEALSLYTTTCTKDRGRRVEFQPPRAGRTAQPASQLGLIGVLERNTCDVALRAAYRGEPVHADRITLIADGVWWSSSRLDFDRQDGWEIATLPLTRGLGRVVRRAIEARDTLVRFESANGYEDVVVTDEMKQDLRVMLDALDAINRL